MRSSTSGGDAEWVKTSFMSESSTRCLGPPLVDGGQAEADPGSSGESREMTASTWFVESVRVAWQLVSP